MAGIYSLYGAGGRSTAGIATSSENTGHCSLSARLVANGPVGSLAMAALWPGPEIAALAFSSENVYSDRSRFYGMEYA